MLILSKPWTSQPQTAARPSALALSRGLWSLATAPARGTIHGRAATFNGSPVVEPGAAGLCWRFVSSSSQYADLGAPPSGPISFVGVIDTTGASNNTFPFSTRSGSAANGIELLYNSGTVLARVQVAGSSAQTGTITVPASGGANVYVVTHDGTDCRLWLNGVEATVANKTGTLTHTQNARLASRAGTYWTGRIFEGAVFTQALSSAEAVSLRSVQDARSFLFAPRIIIIPVSAGAAPTFNPAWAVSSNVVLQPGALQ